MIKQIKALALVFVLAVVAPCFAAGDLNIGTWKLDEAKSRIPAGARKDLTVVYRMTGDNVKVTVDGVDSHGKPIHTEWTGKYDAQDYPITGDPDSNTRSYARISDHTLDLNETERGRVTRVARIDISPDGKTLTVMTTELEGGTRIKGTTLQYYEKQ
jgi:hypothetical protein